MTLELIILLFIAALLIYYIIFSIYFRREINRKIKENKQKDYEKWKKYCETIKTDNE